MIRSDHTVLDLKTTTTTTTIIGPVSHDLSEKMKAPKIMWFLSDHIVELILQPNCVYLYIEAMEKGECKVQQSRITNFMFYSKKYFNYF